ncbi:hypothetical protein MJO28_001660 [Puccinia striiformis f. sp. tritici]|uniref:Uncharacterized protein n=1 Tax=Puccinia striiformis f. sp. tritici TaxID=168172 RepID=A0ACC0EVA2_9BASI|nr:hypothetical protein MJO28_001660 [Puccinia striiformis f. sp. tritici]
MNRRARKKARIASSPTEIPAPSTQAEESMDKAPQPVSGGLETLTDSEELARAQEKARTAVSSTYRSYNTPELSNQLNQNRRTQKMEHTRNLASLGVTGTGDIDVRELNWSEGGKQTLESMSLDFIKLSRSHTGKYLAEMVQLVAEKFGVQNKICGIISDNASNNAVMIDKWKKSKWPRFKAKPHWVWCFTHILNLIVKAILKPFGPQKKNKQNNDYTSEDKDQDDAQQIEMWEEEDLDLEEDDKGVSKVAETEELDIEDINNLSDEEEDNQYTSQPCRQSLAKFQVIARKLKKLPNSKKLFADICEEHTIQTPHRIPQDVQTRWNSTFLQLPSVSCCQSAM